LVSDQNRPSIDEIERIMQTDGADTISINPDGTVERREREAVKPLTFQQPIPSTY
jgi:hypothetical protein